MNCYGQLVTLQAATADCLWYGSFKHAPGCLVLTREPGSNKPCDLASSASTQPPPQPGSSSATPAVAIEPSNAAAKQLTGAGDAHSRTQRAVERAVPRVPRASLIIVCTRSPDMPPQTSRPPARSPYRTKTSPSLADMITKLRAEFMAAAGISGIPPAHRPTANKANVRRGEIPHQRAYYPRHLGGRRGDLAAAQRRAWQ